MGARVPAVPRDRVPHLQSSVRAPRRYPRVGGAKPDSLNRSLMGLSRTHVDESGREFFSQRACVRHTRMLLREEYETDTPWWTAAAAINRNLRYSWQT